MLSDRSYMREETPNAALKPLAWIIGGMFVAFIFENILLHVWPSVIWNWVALSVDGLRHWRVWTPLSYVLLHEPIGDRPASWGFLHISCNALAIFMFGRPLLEHFGARRFYWVFISGILAGAAVWLAVHFFDPTVLYGASAGASALLALFCLQFANQRFTILLFFVLPVTIVPKYLGIISAGISLIFFLFAELFGSPDGIAHSAHLGGMLAGLIAYRWLQNSSVDAPEEKTSLELPRWLAKKKPTSAAAVAEKYRANLPPNRADLKAEVDRILDKINTSGFGSLTADEKRTLDEARDLLSKR